MKVVYLVLFLCLSSLLYSQVTFQNAFPNLTFTYPVEIQNTGVPGDDRLFVVEQEGTIKVFNNNAGVSSSTTFLDIENEVYFGSGQELGLLGLAFHPDYQQNGYFYIYYTKRIGSSNAIITVERIGANPNNPNVADLNNRLVLFEATKNQSNSNHNGGKIAFGPDGYLYISIGDGGGSRDPQNNARNTNRFFGKILRIDVDLDSNNPIDNNGISPDGNYEIPSDNPLVNQSGQDEIYAWGIRNTWKMSFDDVTGRLWGADVGQFFIEEVNLIENGGNYGWDRFEGTSVDDSNVPDPGNTIFPVLEYNHSQGDRSITGGYVYRGSAISSLSPSLFGKYIFADYSTGRVWAMDYDPSTANATREELFRAQSVSLSTFGEDIHGELYFAHYGNANGVIYKIVDGTTPPNAVAVEGEGVWCDDLLGTDGTVNSLIENNAGKLYIAGNFSMAGGTTANNIAVWDGSTWTTLGTGANGAINALVFTSNGDLYAGGSFTNIGGIAANNIAKWNGVTWQALGTGTSGPVAALEVDSNDKIYVGGAFVSAAGITCNNIAIWENAWSAIIDVTNSIAGTNNEVRSIEVDENDIVYVGGNFASAGGNIASRIATWNGSNWGTLGAGTSGFVQAILSTPDYIYAGGNFGIAGGMTVNRIARWNRTTLQWEKLENGLSNSVNTLVEENGYVYAGGAFPSALNDAPDDNVIVNNIVRWKETSGWEALGESTNVGVDILVNALTFINCKLYVGGNFSMAGGNNAENLACWETVCPLVVEVMGADVTGIYEADSLVFNTNDCIVQSGAELIAGKLVELKDGFHAQEGSLFTARIAVCDTSEQPSIIAENEGLIEEIEQPIFLEENTLKNNNLNFQIFPNPTSEITNFKYELTEKSNIQLSIYDLSGKLIKNIVPSQMQETGSYLVEFSTEDLKGIYWVELRFGEERMTRKLVVLD